MTCCRIRQGMSVWAAPEDTPADHVSRIEAVLGVMGEAIRVSDEGHVDSDSDHGFHGPILYDCLTPNWS